ncbi:MAG TPA: hypothetical protein VGX24_02190 [Pyrinomonadaceae bacterium]|nr:hypothetical protein [Pyrinomonadaceae bacterium]
MRFRDGTLIRLATLCAIMLSAPAVREGRDALLFAQQAQSVRPTVAVNNFLTGTYREKNSQDPEIGRKVLGATAHLDDEEREKQARALLRTLRSAPVFAIEQYGTTIMMNYPQDIRVPYEADGKARVMRATGGESITVRAALEGNRLTIDLTWSGGERLRLIFDSPSASKNLTFTRTAGNRFLDRPITVTSEYERTSGKATRIFDRLAATQ